MRVPVIGYTHRNLISAGTYLLEANLIQQTLYRLPLLLPERAPYLYKASYAPVLFPFNRGLFLSVASGFTGPQDVRSIGSEFMFRKE